jgi:tRNA dimethylallyltransferase
MSRSVSYLEKDSLELFTNLPEHPPASKESEAAWKLYALLSELDPITSSRWHWRDTRKILRSLQIIKETGRRASDIMAEQTMNPSQGKPRSAVFRKLPFIYLPKVDHARFRTLFFWLHSEPSELNERLDSRVDKMIQVKPIAEVS